MAKINIDIAVNDKQAKRKIDRLKGSTDQAGRSFDKLSLSVKQSSGAFSSFVGNVAAIGFTRLISGLGGLVSSSIKVTGEIETLSTQFEVLTGSAALANKAVQDLQQFAASTPFQFKDLAKATQRLLSFGFSLEESQENLKDLGDVAAASGTNIGELSLIFGQVAAAGKLTGERLLQLQERAIPIGPALAESLGVAESAVRELVSQGKVDFKTFEKAFKSLNDEGEFAFGGMIKRSRTLEGRISTLKDNFELLQANIGQRLSPVFKALLSTVTLFIQKIQSSSQFQGFLDTIGNSIPAAIETAIDSFSFIINTVFNLGKAFNTIRSNIATAISAILDSVAGFLKGFAKVEEFFGGDTFAKADREFANTLESIADALDDTAMGFEVNAARIEESQKAVNAAIDSSKKFVLKTLDEEIKAAEEQANAVVESNNKKKTSIQELTTEQLKAQEKVREIEAETALLREQNRLEQTENEQIFNEERLIRLQDYLTREEEILIQARLNQTESEFEKNQIIAEAERDSQENRLQSLRDAKDAAAKIVKEDNKQLIELEKFKKRAILDQSAGLFGGLAAIARTGGAKALGIYKVLATAQAVMSGFAAVNKTLAEPTLPYPANIISAAAIGATTAANVISIQQQSFQSGGIVAGSTATGDKQLVRANSGEMFLNRQQQSQLFQMANGQGGIQSGGSQPITINTVVELDNEAVGRATSKWVANGGQLGEVQ